MALDFDGTGDDYVDVGVLTVPQVAGFTAVALINADSHSDKRIVTKAISEAVQDHIFMLGSITGGSLKFRIKTSTTDTLEGGGGLTTGSWQWVAGVYDGSYMRLYVNAVQKTSMSKTGNLANNSWNSWIGNQTPGGATDKPWDGKIADVRLYSRALSVPELETIVACNGHDGIYYGLEHRWMLDGKEGETATGSGTCKDLVGGAHGTPTPTNGPVYRADILSSKRRAA